MLVNSLDFVSTEDTSILSKLDAMSLRLYLTGSRYFNQFSEFPVTLPINTDHDYFCKYSDLNIQNLKEWFPQGKYVAASTLNKEIGQYNDSNIVGVFFFTR